MRKIISYLALALFTLGVLGFLFNGLLCLRIISLNAELPIFSVQGVVLKNNTLYVGLGFYSRVQIYDLKGNYLGYKKTNNHSRDFDFTIDDYGNPKIFVNYYKDGSINHFSDEVDSILNAVLKSPV